MESQVVGFKKEEKKEKEEEEEEEEEEHDHFSAFSPSLLLSIFHLFFIPLFLNETNITRANSSYIYSYDEQRVREENMYFKQQKGQTT